MQANSELRGNQARAEATRTALIAAARQLFVAKGYADTGTPEIVLAADVTRGALYHHFADKAALFAAVAEQAAQEVADAIAHAADDAPSPLQALQRGAHAYFDAMAAEGRARVLLLEAPAVLAPAQWLALSARAGADALRAGLEAARPDAGDTLPLDALTDLLSAAFDRAALAIARGEPAAHYRQAIDALLASLIGN